MSLISDVTHELRALDTSRNRLRRAAYSVGLVLLAASALLAWRGRAPGAREGTLIAGSFLILAGTAFPAWLRPAYRVWMGLAFTLGWFVSRILLTVLFALAVTPIGLVGRLVGKRFLETTADPTRDSYWERRDPARRVDYEKMY